MKLLTCSISHLPVHTVEPIGEDTLFGVELDLWEESANGFIFHVGTLSDKTRAEHPELAALMDHAAATGHQALAVDSASPVLVGFPVFAAPEWV